MSGFVPSQSALQTLYQSLSTYSYLDASGTGLTASPQNFVVKFLTKLDASGYISMNNALTNWLVSSAPASALGLPPSSSNNPSGLRVQVIGDDGTTIFDSSSTNNAFANIKIPRSDFLTTARYLINENQASRPYNMGAILSQTGIYYMSKYSTSVGYNQSYIAVRQGATPALPLGNIVISINGDI
jgi:hypothetical protein